MKQKEFMLYIMLMIALAMLPTMGNAKKIKFGNYITYDGKVENGLPKGKGKLIIVNNDPDVKENAIVEGTFDGWTAGKDLPASVYFLSKDYYPFFSGKTEIIIADDGSSVSFKLISGDFIDRAEGILLNGITNYNIVMTCTPKEDGIYISSTPFVMVKEIKDKKESKYAVKYRNLPSGKIISRCTCQYGDGKYNVKRSNYYEEITTNIGSKYVLSENTIRWITENGSCVYKNDDFHGDWSDKILSFSKQLLEGTLNYNDGILTLTDLQGHKHTVLYYDSHSKTIKNFEQHNLFERDRNTLSKLGLKIIEEGAYKAAKKLTVNNNDKEAMFELGIAILKGDGVKADENEGNAWIQRSARLGGQEAKAYLAEQEAKAEEEELKLAANYGAYQDESGIFFAENMQQLEAGTESASINIGLCYQFGYGVDKNMTKAFEYYKKAADASDEAVKACGDFLMGMCYWKGEGTAKNKAQAFKSWTSYAEYSTSNWADFNDWIGHWTNVELKQLVKPKEMMAYKHYYHAQCYEQGIGTQKYLDEAIGYYAAAVQWKDIADAWYKLGYYAEKGKFATLVYDIPDRNFVRQCYQKAAQLGSNQAKQALNRM